MERIRPFHSTGPGGRISLVQGAGIESEWPLVGRDDELEHALRQLEHPAATGVVIMGPSGVGRTRLGDELAARATAPVIDVPATRSAGSIPFGAFAPFLPSDGRLEHFDDVGHFLHIEQPRMIADLVLEFLEPHR